MVDGEGVVVESSLLKILSLDAHLSGHSHPLGQSVMTRAMLAVFVLCDVDGDSVNVSVLSESSVLSVWMMEASLLIRLSIFWIFA